MQFHDVRPQRRTTRPTAIERLAVVLVLVLAGCSSGQVTGTGIAAPPAGGDGAEANSLPNLSATDISTGDLVALQSLVPADRPLLLWFWAPH